jgi:hypothetical protein
MRRPLVLALVLIAAAARADEPPPLTLCLAPAADFSPVYPLKEVSSTNREFMAVFRLRPGEKIEKLTNVWTAVDIGDFAPPNSEIGRGDMALRGAPSGNFKYSLPKDFPPGKYRLDVSADGKPWASLEFAVVAAAPVVALANPSDLVPLEPGRTWTCSWVLEPGPALKNITVAGAERGGDGKFRTTTTYRVAAREGDVAQVEMGRGGQVVAEEWWSLDAKGLFVTQVRTGGQTNAFDPPVPMIALPLASPHKWTHQPKDGSPATECRMWGPLPVQTPAGEAPGWVVWMKTAQGDRISTIERHYAPGIGIVREVHVDAVGPKLLTRIETALLPAK